MYKTEADGGTKGERPRAEPPRMNDFAGANFVHHAQHRPRASILHRKFFSARSEFLDLRICGKRAKSRRSLREIQNLENAVGRSIHFLQSGIRFKHRALRVSR